MYNFKSLFLYGVIILSFCIAGCGDDSPTSSGPVTNTSIEGTLAYQFETDVATYIKVVKDGKIFDLNSPHGQYEQMPAVSPDGKKVAYIAGSEWSIFIKTIGGGTPQVLASGFAQYPCWSPDGNHIVYKGISPSDNNDRGIFIINADGTGRKKISANFGVPTWSSDGTKIYYSFEDKIYSVSLSGTEYIIKSFGSDHYVGRIDNSPGGGKLAFQLSSGNNFTLSEIYVMPINGSSHYRISEDGVWSLGPSWSPDGNRIVYSYHIGSREIGIMTLADQTFTALTSKSGVNKCHNPSWSL